MTERTGLSSFTRKQYREFPDKIKGPWETYSGTEQDSVRERHRTLRRELEVKGLVVV